MPAEDKVKSFVILGSSLIDKLLSVKLKPPYRFAVMALCSKPADDIVKSLLVLGSSIIEILLLVKFRPLFAVIVVCNNPADDRNRSLFGFGSSKIDKVLSIKDRPPLGDTALASRIVFVFPYWPYMSTPFIYYYLFYSKPLTIESN